MSRSTRREFRNALMPGAALVLPGVANALAARVVADTGFSAAYVTGAGIANSFLGIPDNGLVTLTELADHFTAIRAVFRGPLMVDADTGFGNALNVRRTVEVLERAGADAIQIEDQVFPKRCGHFEGKEVVATAEMLAKIKAAVDARLDPDLLIVARTDAIAVEGFAAAIDRAHAYRDAGADVGFVEAPTTSEQIAAIGRLPWPQLVNVVRGEMTLIGPRAEVPDMVRSYTDDERQTLRVRPGLTGPGQLHFTTDQAAHLDTAADAEAWYREHQLHAKLALDLDYLRHRSLGADVGVLLRTVAVMLGTGRGARG